MRLEDEDVGDVGERGPVGDDPREADLRVAVVDAEADRRSRSSGPRSPAECPPPSTTGPSETRAPGPVDPRGLRRDRQRFALPFHGADPTRGRVRQRAESGRVWRRSRRSASGKTRRLSYAGDVSPMRGAVTLPLWLAVVLVAARGMGGARPAAAAGRAVVRAPPGQPRPRGAEHAPEDPDPAVQAAAARGPDRPAPLRPAGPGGGRGRGAGEGHAAGASRCAASRRYAREIVPAFNAYAYFRFGYWLARNLARSLYRVRLGYSDEPGLAAIPADATVVFLINHRSNMDYILVSYLAAEQAALSYAVGEWARVWPLQTLIRAMGAYFVRRNSKDPLYRKVLERYVGDGDGGRRDAGGLPGGRPLARRAAAAAEARDPRLHAPRVRPGAGSATSSSFRPGSTTTARSRTGRLLARAGAASEPPRRRRGREHGPLRPAEPAGCMARNRWHRFGYACVNFGSPISLRDTCRRRGIDFRGARPRRALAPPRGARARAHGSDRPGHSGRPGLARRDRLRARARTALERARAEGGRARPDGARSRRAARTSTFRAAIRTTRSPSACAC